MVRTLDGAVRLAELRYAAANPRSAQLNEAARRVIPGGTTRSVLAFAPFPFRVSRAFGARLVDVDGHELVDFCGDYTAALLGHDPVVVRDAVHAALDRGWAVGAAHALEIEAAELLCRRFPSIRSVRFTNSGTEANLLAIATALHHTGRDTVLVFGGGYHGSVLAFEDEPGGRHTVNVPYRFAMARYNDPAEVRRMFARHRVGCALVEPMQGAGGCVPATPEFLRVLREECDRSGALLILDEVMTSRLHPGGLQRRLGVTPDLTTLGKYLAGGLSIGAFGGRPDVMAHFAEQAGGQLRHSGTFNNNVLSMATAVAVLRNCLADDVLLANSARGDRLRGQLDAALASAGLPMPVTGMGSVFHIHAADPRWLHWLFHALLADGYYISPRGLVALSLAVTDADCAGLLSAVRAWTRQAARLHPVAA